MERKTLMANYRQSEKEFRQQVLDLALHLGYKTYFTWGSFHSPKGYPDLTLVRETRLIFIELKSERGKLSLEQEEWLEALRATRKCEVYSWYPQQWEEICKILGGER